MPTKNNFEVVCLADFLDSSEGEDFFKNMSCSFSSINKDVEKFLKEKAIQSTKLGTSSTYILIHKGQTPQILGYFTLAIKILTINLSSLSKSVERVISRFGYYDETYKTYHIPAILIAQFGRNFNKDSNTISGLDLMAITLKYVRDILHRTSGKTVFLECEKKEKLIDFYKKTGFTVLDNEVLSKDKRKLMQLYRLV